MAGVKKTILPLPTRSALKSRLRVLFEARRLSPANRRVADYLIEHAPESIFLSSIELSSAVGVSQPSTTRFARALGYGGFAELQDVLRDMLVTAEGTAQPVNHYQAGVVEAIETLDQLRVSLGDSTAIAKVGRHLAASVPLVVLAARTGAPAASHFAYFAARIHPDVRMLTVEGAVTMEHLLQARQSGATWVLCFVLPRCPKDLLTAARYAKRIGLHVATVTDQVTAVAGEFSDIILPAATGKRLVFTTYAAPIVLSGVLLQALHDAAPQRARSRLRHYERMVSEHGLFHPEPNG